MAFRTRDEATSGRRQFLWRSVLTALGSGLFGGAAHAEKQAGDVGGLRKTGEPLTTRVRQGEPPQQPLDSMVVFERGDNNNGRAGTHEVLSLIHEEKGKVSYPWTLYTSLATHHETGDACVLCSRLHKHGPGWSSGLHSEVFNHGRAVALGVNIEMSSDYAGPEPTQVIGLNIQAVGGPRSMQHGIHVHDNGQGHFEKAIGLDGASEIGLDITGRCGVGIHTHGNNIRLSEGACVELDDQGKIKVRYLHGRVEFLNGDRCFGHLDVNGEDHPL